MKTGKDARMKTNEMLGLKVGDAVVMVPKPNRLMVKRLGNVSRVLKTQVVFMMNDSRELRANFREATWAMEGDKQIDVLSVPCGYFRLAREGETQEWFDGEAAREVEARKEEWAKKAAERRAKIEAYWEAEGREVWLNRQAIEIMRTPTEAITILALRYPFRDRGDGCGDQSTAMVHFTEKPMMFESACKTVDFSDAGGWRLNRYRTADGVRDSLGCWSGGGSSIDHAELLTTEQIAQEVVFCFSR